MYFCLFVLRFVGVLGSVLGERLVFAFQRIRPGVSCHDSPAPSESSIFFFALENPEPSLDFGGLYLPFLHWIPRRNKGIKIVPFPHPRDHSKSVSDSSSPSFSFPLRVFGLVSDFLSFFPRRGHVPPYEVILSPSFQNITSTRLKDGAQSLRPLVANSPCRIHPSPPPLVRFAVGEAFPSLGLTGKPLPFESRSELLDCPRHPHTDSSSPFVGLITGEFTFSSSP